MGSYHYDGVVLHRNNKHPVDRSEVGWMNPTTVQMRPRALEKIKMSLRGGKVSLAYTGTCNYARDFITKQLEERQNRDDQLGIDWYIGYVKAHKATHDIPVNWFRNNQAKYTDKIDVVFVRTSRQSQPAPTADPIQAPAPTPRTTTRNQNQSRTQAKQDRTLAVGLQLEEHTRALSDLKLSKARRNAPHFSGAYSYYLRQDFYLGGFHGS